MSNELYLKLCAKKPTWEKVRKFGCCIERAKDSWADYQQAVKYGTIEDATHFNKESSAQWERAEKLYALIVSDLDRMVKQARHGRITIIRKGGRRK